MANQTGVLDINSSLVRNKWAREGMVTAKAKSWWSPLVGSSSESIVYQRNDISQSEGHTIIFDYDSGLEAEAFRGTEQAFGKGVSKLKFSDSLTVEVLRWAVNNGRKFDGVNIGDLSINEHSDSRNKLADLFTRSKDQMLFDACTGYLNGAGLTNIIRPNGKSTFEDPTKTIADLVVVDKMDYDFLVDMETMIKEGLNGTRRPLEPYTFDNGDALYLCIVTSQHIKQLKQDSQFQTIVSQADVRGAGNMLLKGIQGRIGNLLIMEAPNYFGTSTSKLLGKAKVDIAGLRSVDENGVFSGESTAQSGIVASRGFILGKSALKMAFGKQPDYKWQESQDFGITSESAMEVWMNVGKVTLVAETDDHEVAKIAGFDYGVIGFETYSKTIV